MREIEGIEKVIEKIRPHWKEIDNHFLIENEYFKTLFNNPDYDRLGRALKCHLIVEHYLDRFLGEHYLIDNLKSAKLSFFQKATLLPNKGSSAAFVKPGIFNLNKVRNKFAHTLNYKIEKEDMTQIYEVLKIARKETKFYDPLDALEAFTTISCTWLIILPKHLAKVFSDAFADVNVHIPEEEN